MILIKDRKMQIATFGLICMFLFIVFSADSCGTASGSPTSNVTSSTTSTSNGVTDATCAQVQFPLACKSIVKRYQYLGDPNKYGYFYGFVQGVASPVIEYVVQGSVFPVSDLISNPNYQQSCTGKGSGACAVVLDKQQPDGTFGTNGYAMFGWTADGNYFEWDGPYAYAQQPLSFVGVKVVGCKTGVPGC